MTRPRPAPHPVNPARPRPLPRPTPPRPTPPRPGRLAYVAVLATVALATGAVSGLMAWFFGGGWTA